MKNAISYIRRELCGIDYLKSSLVYSDACFWKLQQGGVAMTEVSTCFCPSTSSLYTPVLLLSHPFSLYMLFSHLKGGRPLTFAASIPL